MSGEPSIAYQISHSITVSHVSLWSYMQNIFKFLYYFLAFMFWCVCLFVRVGMQTQWTAAPQTVMEMESVSLDTATALLDSWVLTVPKVRNIYLSVCLSNFSKRASLKEMRLSYFPASQHSLEGLFVALSLFTSADYTHICRVFPSTKWAFAVLMLSSHECVISY